MSGNSSVGNSQVYEAGDQRPDPQQGEDHSNAYEEGKENSHQANDSKDQRSIGNRLAAAGPQNDSSSGKALSAEDKAAREDPTLPAKMHGNEPSKGAKIDKEIEDEEAEIIAKKDAAKAQSKKH
ncbi:hypothetical protein EDD37DRAFT_613781 [Exophiala viscosa]|uniref:Uncharacterized protein n=1 Tax=Exophiala viscosa TaxID=2486360 RepID=A0AAN6E0R5_9EURO|nr:hypothetical protein EDD36DRAFT_463263 [Exophiala viscosa]KAI1619450.1 hypothetical protein EDD37DRAFT_613781 [Exophiala viscosa]